MKLVLFLFFLGFFAVKAQEHDEGELGQEYPEEYPVGMFGGDEVSGGELQKESEDELSEDSVEMQRAEGEKLVGDDWSSMWGGVRASGTTRPGRRRRKKTNWLGQEIIRSSKGRRRAPFGSDIHGPAHRRRYSRRRFRRELQEVSEKELSEESEELEIADRGNLGGWNGAYERATRRRRARRRRSQRRRSGWAQRVGQWWLNSRRRRRFRRELQDESDDEEAVSKNDEFAEQEEEDELAERELDEEPEEEIAEPEEDEDEVAFFWGRRRKTSTGSTSIVDLARRIGRRRRRGCPSCFPICKIACNVVKKFTF